MVSMNFKKLKVLFILLFLILLFQYKGYSQEDKGLYCKGVQAARNGKIDFTFMYFHKLLNDFPESEYLQEALFGTGEYYFSIANYSDATSTFNRFINNYPESEAKPFAIVYLLEIAKKRGKEDEVEKLRKELVSLQQLSLLFRDFKELQYFSPLRKNYKALNFIDKIEIYIDDELFSKIPY